VASLALARRSSADSRSCACRKLRLPRHRCLNRARTYLSWAYGSGAVHASRSSARRAVGAGTPGPDARPRVEHHADRGGGACGDHDHAARRARSRRLEPVRLGLQLVHAGQRRRHGRRGSPRRSVGSRATVRRRTGAVRRGADGRGARQLDAGAGVRPRVAGTWRWCRAGGRLRGDRSQFAGAPARACWRCCRARGCCRGCSVRC
jgi:hypothetical protein